MNGVDRLGRPSLTVRVAIALGVGIFSGSFSYWYLSTIDPNFLAFDFTWAWRGARFLLAGKNPYIEIQPVGEFPFNSAFKYPLTAAVLALPVARLPPHAAAAIFQACGGVLLAFALTSDGYWRLPVLASSPYFMTLEVVQSSSFITAAALLPGVAWLSFCLKPTTALASFAYRPYRSAIVGTAIAFTLCLLIIPLWPLQWVRAMLFDPSTRWYIPALRLPGGILLLLAALRWRTPEGRLLLIFAVVPQVQVFYTGLVALLVARNLRESLVLALASCFGYIGWRLFDWSFDPTRILDPVHQAQWVMLSVYLPALAIVLRHPNEGDPPRLLAGA